MSFDFKLNIVDLAMLIVTGGIAVFVWQWDRRTTANALLWEVSREHWRTAVALYENKWKASQTVAEEIETRQIFINRTVRQIRMLDSPKSPLAKAFEDIAEHSKWDASSKAERDINANLLRELTYQMASRFGSRKAKKVAKAQLGSGSGGLEKPS